MNIMLFLILSPLIAICSESIGSYNNGSLKSSVSLSVNELGIQTMRPWAEKFYGHSELRSFIYKIGKDSINRSLGQLMIGDLSYKNGGVLPGHASHQNGLDVDIWFYRPSDSDSNLPDSMRDPALFPHYLNPRTNQFYPNLWDTRLDEIIKISAQDKRVARIFVNPGVKKRLCSIFPNEDFLKKIRPWFRHHEHFHVRLKCPKNSKNCINQDEIVEIGCSGDDFEWWFSEDFKKVYDDRYGISNQKKSIAPTQCDA